MNAERAMRAAARSCAGGENESACSACCVATDLPALPGEPKPAMTPCRFLGEAVPGQAGRCSRHEDRPPACAEFTCLWRQGAGTDRERPDRLGLLWYVSPAVAAELGERDVVLAVELAPGAWALQGETFLQRWLALEHLVYLQRFEGEGVLLGPTWRLEEVAGRREARQLIEEAVRKAHEPPKTIGAPKRRPPSGWGG